MRGCTFGPRSLTVVSGSGDGSCHTRRRMTFRTLNDADVSVPPPTDQWQKFVVIVVAGWFLAFGIIGLVAVALIVSGR